MMVTTTYPGSRRVRMVRALAMAGYRPSRVPVNGPRPVWLPAVGAERVTPDASVRNAVTRPCYG
jgi:hypothetical protein